MANDLLTDVEREQLAMLDKEGGLQALDPDYKPEAEPPKVAVTEAPKVEATAPDEAPKVEPPKTEATPTAEVPADDKPLPTLEELRDDAVEPGRAQLQVTDDVSGADKYLDNLKAHREALHEKFDGGDLTQAEYRRELDKVNDEITRTSLAIDRAETAQRNNDAAMKQLFSSMADTYQGHYNELQSVSGSAAWAAHVEGLKSDETVKKMAADGVQPGKIYTYVLRTAHQKMREDLGLVSPKKASTPPADARKPAPPPKTLTDIPQAAPANTGAGEFADLDSLKGEELELRLARLTPEQRERRLQGL